HGRRRDSTRDRSGRDGRRRAGVRAAWGGGDSPERARAGLGAAGLGTSDRDAGSLGSPDDDAAGLGTSERDAGSLGSPDRDAAGLGTSEREAGSLGSPDDDAAAF